jgi:hypothetical protein
MSAREPTEAEIEQALADEEQRHADHADGGSQYWEGWHARNGSAAEWMRETDRAWDAHLAQRDSREAS